MNLILTIGTGTAGKYSSLAEGMAASVRLAQAECFWLVPSASADSIAIADLVRELVAEQGGNTAAFQPWDGDASPYCTIANPDDLNDCHQTLLMVIRRVKERMKADRKPVKIVVNPTSGTKQMSAGATLASLEADIDEIVFTVGERKDGVVVTGTEYLTTINSRALLGRRALAESRRLIQAGSFAAARDLLGPYCDTSADCQHTHDLAAVLYYWQRLRYHEALRCAASSDHPSLKRLRISLQPYVKAGPNDACIVLDLLDSACFLQDNGFHEEALARAYRATEAAAKCVLENDFDTREPYDVRDLQRLCPRQHQKFASMAQNGKVQIGLRQSYEILDSLDHPLGNWYFSTNEVQRTLQRRNQSLYGHGGAHRHPENDDIATVVDGLRQHLTVNADHKLPRRSAFIREALT